MKFSDWKIKYINVLQRGMPRGSPPKPKRVKGEANLDKKLRKKKRDSKRSKIKYEKRKEKNNNKQSEENALTSDEDDDDDEEEAPMFYPGPEVSELVPHLMPQ